MIRRFQSKGIGVRRMAGDGGQRADWMITFV